MVRVGIIGCGNISRFHLEGYARAGARIVRVCDLRSEVAEATASRVGARAGTDYREVLADHEVDLVSVLTFAAAHQEVCLEAIAAGKGVVCEKTLSDNAADSAEIARAAAEAGTFFATAYMKRFFPATQQAKALLADMGEVISVHARSWQPWDLWHAPLDEAFTSHPSVLQRQYGGGALVCCGSHILDLVHWLAGRPTRVCGRLRVREGMDADLQANALLWLPEGGMAHFETCWHPLARVGYERNGWDERLEINTTEGRLDLYTVKWDAPLNNGALLVHHEAGGKVTEYRYPPVNPFDLETAEMVRRFGAGEPGFPSAYDGYVVDALIAGITESSRKGATAEMRWESV